MGDGGEFYDGASFRKVILPGCWCLVRDVRAENSLWGKEEKRNWGNKSRTSILF